MPGNYSPFARRAYALPPVRRHKPPAPSKGWGAPAGYAFLRDAQGNYLTDTQGNRLLARAA